MADQTDVEKALVTLISATLYPSGVPLDPTQSAIGVACRIARGWPEQAALDADLKANVVNVTVFPRPNMERNVTRYSDVRIEGVPSPKTYGASVAGQVVTITGAAPSPYYPHNIALVVDGYPYPYQALAGQTAAQVAAGLLAAVTVDFPTATLSGAAITLPATARVGTPNIGTVADVTREVSRQQKQYQVVYWCPTPDLRDTAAGLVDAVLHDTPFLTLADGSSARMIYRGSITNDAPQKELLFRRDGFYEIEYATTRIETATQIVAPSVTAVNYADEAMFTAPPRP